jgi:hypothetical protein
MMHKLAFFSNLERGRRPLALALLLTAIAGTTLVIACGPDFPAQLLDDRSGTLRGTPANSFAYEATHLVPSGDSMKAVEASYYDDSHPGSPDDADKTLSTDLRARLAVMRKSKDGDAAYAAGAGVPPALRLYTAGAVDYRRAYASGADAPGADAADVDASNANASGAHASGTSAHESAAFIARARRRFQAVLDLPPEAGAPRAVWAAYMLATLQAQALDEAGPSADAGAAKTRPDEAGPARNIKRDQAARAFELVRQRALAGADDSQGLAVASYGQQARLFLYGPGGTCAYDAPADNDDCTDAITPGGMKEAIALYAAQAAHGSDSGLQSLRTLAEWALYDPANVRGVIDDPLAQRLLVAYALARVGDIVDGKPDSASDPYAVFDLNGQPGLADAGTGNTHITPNPLLATLVDALLTLPPERLDGADRVAALAYRAGRYDLAARLAGRLETPLAWWVRAKLATRQGDAAAAALAYSHAVQAFPQNANSIAAPGRARLRGEQGVLSLSRGQYVDALDQLYQATLLAQPASLPDEGPIAGDYWNDLAYVAERVLTTAELRAYVDAHVPASPVPAVDMAKLDAAQNDWMRQHSTTVADRLRQLLARRMMREGARAQALPYFPADDDARFMEGVWVDNAFVWKPRHLRQAAADYDSALKQAHDAWRDNTRAQAWFRAAMLARRQGMDLLGYEQDPDYAVYDGGYTYGAGRDGGGRNGLVGAGADAKAGAKVDTPAERAARDLPGPYVTDDERRRYAASEAVPYARFHYREIAADHAVEAAGLLPERSQAYAATLCRATRFIIDDDPDRASSIYARYVKQGAAVPFGATFGRECPEPDFRAAARFPYVQAWRMVRRHPVPAALAAAAGVGLLAALAVGIVRLRRRADRTARA